MEQTLDAFKMSGNGHTNSEPVSGDSAGVALRKPS